MASSQRVIVGLSGGVDSSVAALLLLEQGYHVEGLFMKNWEEDDPSGHCPAARDLRDAETVAARLGIRLHRMSFAYEYWEQVFTQFLAEHRAGRTPNPDVLCNREIKFKAFLEYALELGADRIATGHYARIERLDGGYAMLKGLDPNKDQSYFLYALDQCQLARALFPLGGLTKTHVRELARRAGLATHDKKDSTGICFIGERPFKQFLTRYLPPEPGEMRTPDGTLVGHHDGLMYYTLGQRAGLGIGGQRGATSQPWYVLDKDQARNRLVVGQGHAHPWLLARELTAAAAHWIGDTPGNPLTCAAKARYRQPDRACTVRVLDDGRWRVRFALPQRALTPGQSVVLYAGERCLGGAAIEDVVREQP